MDGGQGSSRHTHDPEGLLRSALEKIVFFECRVSQLESELGAARTAAERARGEAAGVRRREVELEQSLAAEKGARGDAERRAGEAEERVRLLETERERLLGGLVERARIEGAPGGGDAGADDGQADLAGFIAELRAEIEALRAFKTAAVAAGYGDGAPAPERRAPQAAASVAELGGRFDAEGRVGVSAGDRARLADLLATRADRALYERSMDDLSAPDAGKRLRAVRALEALGSRAAAPLLAAALSREADAEVKGALLAAVARFKEPFAADLADRELGDARPAVRVAALEALATVGDGRAPDRLSAALTDESPVVRRRAALLLGFTAGEKAVDALAVALCDPDRGVARAAAAALSGRPSARAQSALARGLEHPDVSVRRAAAAALGRLSGEEVDADGTASARRASSRRIAERLATMDGEELRAAVLRSAESARVTAERVRAVTEARVGAAGAGAGARSSASTSVSTKSAAIAKSAPATASTATSTATAKSTPTSLSTPAARVSLSTGGEGAQPSRSGGSAPETTSRLATASATPAARVSLSPTGGEGRGEGAQASRSPRATVAVVTASAGDPELEPRVVAELRSALRGGTESGLAVLLGAPAARVEVALAALAARGQVERRGTRWYVS